MFKGILTVAVSLAISATAFGLAEKRGGKEAEVKGGADSKAVIEKAQASAAEAKGILDFARVNSGNAVAKLIAADQAVALRLFTSEAQVKALTKTDAGTVLTALWFKMLAPYAKATDAVSSAALLAGRGMLQEAAVVGIEKMARNADKILALRESPVAMRNLGLLHEARAVAIARMGEAAGNVTTTARAIELIRTKALSAQPAKEAKELAEEIEGNNCTLRI